MERQSKRPGLLKKLAVGTTLALSTILASPKANAGAILRTNVPDKTWEVGQTQTVYVTLDTTAPDVSSYNITGVEVKLQAPAGMDMTIISTAPFFNSPEHLYSVDFPDDFFSGYDMYSNFGGHFNNAAPTFGTANENFSFRKTNNTYNHTYGPTNNMGTTWIYDIRLDSITTPGQTGNFSFVDDAVIKDLDTTALPGTTQINDTFTAWISGDFDSDGEVDAGDLSLLLSKWGSTSRPEGWNENFDGFVDANELSGLLGNWGYGISSPQPLSSAPIPEPATLGLLGLGSLAYASRRRKE